MMPDTGVFRIGMKKGEPITGAFCVAGTLAGIVLLRNGRVMRN
jgi:hypothetical protein